MSKEKLYAIKNDEGKLADTRYNFGYGAWVTPYKNMREEEAKNYGGHVVTLIEEPEKVVLSEKQAEIVDYAHSFHLPASHIARNCDEDGEELLMKAYVNGYTVAKEKKYLVDLDGLVTIDGDQQYLTKKDGKWFASRKMPGMHQYFTDEELNKAPKWVQQLNREEMTADIEHYGLQDCEKEEAADDGIR